MESDDAFQTDHYVGGYDSTENAFCFSYYNDNNEEYWFQIKLSDILQLTEKDFDSLTLRKAMD
ncbi:MAG: hypothetical protein KBD31_03175 [Proteobacteria bacterium]|nr:hypothetical protein [Pseudomonadota bacterium]